ncbi:hypothetical protein [Halopiger goleimassiliensis]|uniref:hypothetical protein n=1 Tax=Halopiger goleimassiliensis TaxID=1293048 RepID=UPI000677A1D3|nr:hypothetical protein [Halopiger goleimassiliensis]
MAERMTAAKPTYSESQSLPSWLPTALLVVSAPSLLLVAVVLVDEYGLTLQAEFYVTAVAVLVLGPIPLVHRAGLRTEVRDDGLWFRFVPIHRSDRHVPFESIERVRLAERRAFQYGIQRTRWGWEYRPNASEGVEVYRREGPPLFLGSERPHELRTTIETGMRRSTSGD